MTPPDKIYMTPSYGEPDNVLLASFSKSHLDYHRDIEYIRKDVLLEWAKNEKAWLKQGHKHEWSNDDILFGGELILDNLIEKLESL